MAPGSVKNATFAMRADPRPRLRSRTSGQFSFASFLQYDAVDRIVLVMDIGFVPAFEAAEALHDFMFWCNNLGCESFATVLFELCAAQFDVLVRIQKAIGRTVQWNKAMTACNVIQECRFLAFGDLDCVCIDEQYIKPIEPFAFQCRFCVVAIFQVDANVGKRLLNRSKQRSWLMMTFVTQHDHLDAFFAGGCDLSPGWATQETHDDEGKRPIRNAS